LQWVKSGKNKSEAHYRVKCIINRVYNVAFVNSERWLAKSRVDITQCQHGNVGKFLSLYFFVLYYKTNIKHFFRIDIQLYQHLWKLGKLEIVWIKRNYDPISQPFFRSNPSSAVKLKENPEQVVHLCIVYRREVFLWASSTRASETH
jgi:hypothetical protein